MFREMRRKTQLLAEEENVRILKSLTAGVLALNGDDGYPYAVPISYVYADGRLYFHCALSGHKMDAIARSNKASFCVVEQNEIIPEKFTTHYRSVIAFGRIGAVDDNSEKVRILRLLAAKYSPKETEEAVTEEIEAGIRRATVLEMKIEHLTGKESMGLVRTRKNNN